MPGDRRSGPAGICAAAVGPVGFVALHNCFQTPGPFFTSGIKIPVLQVPAHIPACKPPDGQGRRGGDGDGFVQACVHPQPDLRQFFRFIPDDVTGFPVAGIASWAGCRRPAPVRAVHPHRMPIRFIVPIDILREPDDVTLVRFSLAQNMAKRSGHRPPPPQSDGAGAPVRHLPAEIASDLPRLLP